MILPDLYESGTAFTARETETLLNTGLQDDCFRDTALTWSQQRHGERLTTEVTVDARGHLSTKHTLAEPFPVPRTTTPEQARHERLVWNVRCLLNRAGPQLDGHLSLTTSPDRTGPASLHVGPQVAELLTVIGRALRPGPSHARPDTETSTPALHEAPDILHVNFRFRATPGSTQFDRKFIAARMAGSRFVRLGWSDLLADKDGQYWSDAAWYTVPEDDLTTSPWNREPFSVRQPDARQDALYHDTAALLTDIAGRLPDPDAVDIEVTQTYGTSLSVQNGKLRHKLNAPDTFPSVSEDQRDAAGDADVSLSPEREACLNLGGRQVPLNRELCLLLLRVLQDWTQGTDAAVTWHAVTDDQTFTFLAAGPGQVLLKHRTPHTSTLARLGSGPLTRVLSAVSRDYLQGILPGDAP